MRKKNTAFVAFPALVLWSVVTFIAGQQTAPPADLRVIGGLYFLEVNRDDAERLSREIQRLTQNGSGYIMGTSLIFNVKSDKACGQSAELEAYLEAYLGSNQYVCYPTEFLEQYQILLQ